MRFILGLILALLICGSSVAQYRGSSYGHRSYGHGYSYSHSFRGYNSYHYYPSYQSYSYQNVGWKYYAACWYKGRYYKAGYYAQIGNQWHLQGHGPYDGEAAAPAAPAPTGKGGLTPDEVAKLKELLKKLDN